MKPSTLYDRYTIAARPGLRLFPIIHGSLEYTVRLRELFRIAPPSLVAAEVSEKLAAHAMQALPYADQIPVLSYDIEGLPLHFIMEPLEPLVEGLRSAYEAEIPLHFIDALPTSIHLSYDVVPDTLALRSLSPNELYEIYNRSSKTRRQTATDPAAKLEEAANALVEAMDQTREYHMAEKVRNLARLTGALNTDRPLLVVCGLKHARGLQRLLSLDDRRFERARPAHVHESDEEPLEALLKENQIDTDIQISTLSPESPEVLDQPPLYNTLWLASRKSAARHLRRFDRIALQRMVYRQTVERYERESGSLIPAAKQKLFFQFARNLSLVSGRIIPDRYRLLVSARGFVDDHFARMMNELLSTFPRFDNPAFPRRKITLDEIHRKPRYLTFRRSLKPARSEFPAPSRRRFRRERYPGEWLESWKPGGICSYPPEDIVIEGFARYLQDRAQSIYKGTETRTAPFTSSLMDGIDYRETIRNRHLGKIFVREERLRRLQAGSVVIVFDEEESEYPWHTVWGGEHAEESDMGFYATPPAELLVGPGISRCMYGGLVMVYPPGQLHDFWHDPRYDRFDSLPDKLLAAAIQYNDRKSIAYVAPSPPSQRMRSIAGRFGQHIVHIPISSMNPVKMGRIRRFHVLDSNERRENADDYIW